MRTIYTPFVIDRRSSVPYDEQISNQLRDKIMLNKLDPTLLDIDYLSSILNVDQETVVKGMERLVEHEVLAIDKKTHKYYVNYGEYTIIKDDKVISYHQLMRKLRQKPSIKIIKEEQIICDQALSNISQIDIDSCLYKQTRLYFGDHFPKYYTETFFTQNFFDLSHLSEEDIANKSYIKLLEDEHIPYKSLRVLKSVDLPDHVNDLLNQPHLTAGLSSRETHYDKNGNILVFSIVYMNMNYALKVI